MVRRREILGTVGVSLAAGCTSSFASTGTSEPSFSVHSDAIIDGEPGPALPHEHAEQGGGESPPLRLANVPTGTESVVITLEDVTGRDEIPLWLLWNVEPATERIPAGLPNEPTLEELGGATQGTNARGEVGYSGPDLEREYESRDSEGDYTAIAIRAYAVASRLDLGPEARHRDLMDAINEHDRVSASLYATVKREG